MRRLLYLYTLKESTNYQLLFHFTRCYNRFIKTKEGDKDETVSIGSQGDVYKRQVRSLFDVQRPDGFIPHMSAPDWSSEVTQPPVVAWGIYKLYEKTGRTDWLSDSYDSLKRYLEWNFKNRDTNHNYLFEWDVNADSPNCRCDECGMDNSCLLYTSYYDKW